MKTLSVILPAHNEAALIGPCLTALLASDSLPDGWQGEVLVIANGCSDATAAIALSHEPKAGANGWALQVIDVVEGGKLNALNVGDAAACGDIRIYLDADVTMEPALIRQLVAALDTPLPRYASGKPHVAPPASEMTGLYARLWTGVPFVQNGVPGFGLFAMNSAGRDRWAEWPAIISDDTFARFNFAPSERVGVSASYHWPMVEGFANLVRVRRRQNQGVEQIASRFPDLLVNDDKPRLPLVGQARRMIGDPLGFFVYGAVALAVKTPLFRSAEGWVRGR